jgi:hypothetical protein
MIDLRRISKGRLQSAPRVLWYGFEGVGKTRAASGAPDPFVLDVDKGSRHYDVKRVVPETWGELLEWVSAVESGKVECGSLVIDSMTALEFLAYTEFFPGSNIDKWDGGYGKGDTHALIRWRELLAPLERIQAKGKAVIMTANTIVKKFDDPTGPGYERFEVAVRPRVAGLLKQWNEFVFFCREDVVAVSSKNDKGRATTTGTRWAYTKRCPAFDAKSRGGVLFPEKFLLSWDEFMKAVASEDRRSSEMQASISAMLEEISDAELSKVVTGWIKGHPDQLLEAHQSLTVRLESHRAAKQAIADGSGASAGA